MKVSQGVSWQTSCANWDFNAVCKTENELITDSSTAASMVKAMTEMPSWFISSIWSFIIVLLPRCHQHHNIFLFESVDVTTKRTQIQSTSFASSQSSKYPPSVPLYSQTGCSFPRNFANFGRNVGILIGSLL